MAEYRYRINISETQISLLVGIISKSEQISNPEVREIYKRLREQEFKIQEGIKTPEYVKKNKPSKYSIEGLGLDGESAIIKEKLADVGERRELAYKNWMIDPTKLSADDLEYAQTYRYENGLMSKEEETELEKKMFGM